VGTVVWLGATIGFAAAGLGLLGLPHLRWRRLTIAGAVGSFALLGLFATQWAAVAVVIDVMLLAIALSTRPRIAPTRPPDEARAPRPAWRRVTRAAGCLAGYGFLAYLALVIAVRPWQTRWGATPAEIEATLPGDELLKPGALPIHHAITIRAPAEAVWPWLVQIGQDRAGFYSYTWLENLVGARIHNADRIVPGWQRLERGDFVHACPRGYLGGAFGDSVGWSVERVVEGRAIVLRYWGAFVVEPVDAGTSRLLVRTHVGPKSLVWSPLEMLAFEPIHFVMERGMLRGVRARAERGWAEAGPAG
jgi:hypothetical protein